MLPCVAGRVSWLFFCSLVSLQSRQFLQTPERAKEDMAFLRALMSQEGDVENEMPLGEGQDNSELWCQLGQWRKNLIQTNTESVC